MALAAGTMTHFSREDTAAEVVGGVVDGEEGMEYGIYSEYMSG